MSMKDCLDITINIRPSIMVGDTSFEGSVEVNYEEIGYVTGATWEGVYDHIGDVLVNHFKQ